MKYRIWSLLWVMALFASAMATFGALGIFGAIVVLFLWITFHQTQTTSPHGCSVLIGILLTFCFVVALLIPTARQQSRNNYCKLRLKWLSLYLDNYQHDHGTIPIASLKINDKPAHSWRSELLGVSDNDHIHSQIDFSEPWDGTKNMAFFTRINMEEFQCPEHYRYGTSFCSYFAVVDPRTAWPPDRAAKLEDIKDGTANTILLIEAPHRNIKWYEPKDLSIDEAIELLTSVPSEEDSIGHRVNYGYFYKPSYGIHLVFVDGEVRLIPLPVNLEIAIALLTKAGGEEIDPTELQSELGPELDYGKVFALCAFLLIAVLPAVKLRGKAVKEVPRDQV